MKPIANSLDRLQGEKNVSIGSVLPCLYYIRAEITNIDLASKYAHNLNLAIIANEMRQALKNIFDDRFSSMMNFERGNRDLILAAVSHPVYKLNWISDENNMIFARSLLEEEAKRIVEETTPTTCADESIDIEEDEFLPTNTPLLRRSSTEQCSSIGVEILNFFDERDKNINILNKYPIIGTVFRRFNTTLSASSPVERLFSQALLVFTPRRNRISDDNFEKALLLKTNFELWS